MPSGLYYSYSIVCKCCHSTIADSSENPSEMMEFCPKCRASLSEGNIERHCGECGSKVGECSHTTGIFK